MWLLIKLVMPIIVLGVVLRFVVGKASLPSFGELALKVLITSVIALLAGGFAGAINIILGIIVSFIIYTAILAFWLGLDFKQTALCVAIQQVVLLAIRFTFGGMYA